MNAGIRIEEESLAGDIGIFARFPRGRTSCITCPPGRSDHFLLRVLWRGILPFTALNFIPTDQIPKSLIPKKRWAIYTLLIIALLLLAPPTLLYGLIAECLIESLATAKKKEHAYLRPYRIGPYRSAKLSAVEKPCII